MFTQSIERDYSDGTLRSDVVHYRHLLDSTVVKVSVYREGKSRQI